MASRADPLSWDVTKRLHPHVPTHRGMHCPCRGTIPVLGLGPRIENQENRCGRGRGEGARVARVVACGEVR